MPSTRDSVGAVRSAAEHLNELFAVQVQSFAAELDQRAREHFPAVISQALAAYGIPTEQMSPRETAFVDAILAGMLQVLGEIVGLAMRRSADLLIEALTQATVGYPSSIAGSDRPEA
jgi:hypothetical protein